VALRHKSEEVKTAQLIMSESNKAANAKYDQELGKQHDRLERHRKEIDLVLKLCMLAEAQEGELFEMQKLMTSMGEKLCHCNDPVCPFALFLIAVIDHLAGVAS